MIKKVTTEDENGTYEIEFRYYQSDGMDVMLRQVVNEGFTLKRAVASRFNHE